MVTSIVLTGMYDIGVSSTGKIKTPDGNVVELKDIPFVRYRFQHYGEEELKFIMNNKKKFPCVHVVEITLDSDTADTLNKIEELETNLGVMVYVDVTDTEVANKGFSEETEELLEDISECKFDRLNIRDKSTSLFSVDLMKLKKELRSLTGIKEDEIGVCGGPMCFINGNACLTAVKAREMLAKYSEHDDSVVPSANHEGKMDNADNIESCVNRCGCIRYHIFNHDMEAPATKSQGTKKVNVKTSTGNKEVEVKKEEKKPKTDKPKMYPKMIW